MTEAEYAAWRDESVRAYAVDKVRAGVWAADGANERSAAEFEAMLPSGLSTPDTLLLTGVDEEGAAVGRLCLRLQVPGGRPDGLAWVYDIEVVEERRGQGYGRALLAAAEDELRARGAAAVGLNVFGSNRTAMALYASSGYEVTAQQMRKDLRDMP